MTDEKIKFMKAALKEADKAEKKEEVPIGCVIVKDGKIFTRAHNLRQTKRLATAHAETLAIEKACRKLGDWRLDDCELYVTLEPCAMCAHKESVFRGVRTERRRRGEQIRHFNGQRT